MKYEKFDKNKHYEQLRVFWKQYDWIAPEVDVLPETGYVAMVDDKPIAACFVYLSNSALCFMDWMIADKEANPDHRKEAVNGLIDKIKEQASESGYKIIYTITANTHLIGIYGEHGFQPMEKNAYSMAFSTNKNTDFLR